MDMHAYRNDGAAVTVTEPISHTVRYTMEDRDGEQFADLNDADLAELWEKLPHGASSTERGEIECYLCRVAELTD